MAADHVGVAGLSEVSVAGVGWSAGQARIGEIEVQSADDRIGQEPTAEEDDQDDSADHGFLHGFLHRMCYQQAFGLKPPDGGRFLPLRNVYINSSQGEKLWVADGGVPITATHGAETEELQDGDEEGQDGDHVGSENPPRKVVVPLWLFRVFLVG